MGRAIRADELQAGSQSVSTAAQGLEEVSARSGPGTGLKGSHVKRRKTSVDTPQRTGSSGGKNH